MKISVVATLTAVTVLMTGVAASWAQPLRRDLDAYFVFAQRRASLKNLKLDSACNVGVNCGSVSATGTCGTLALADVNFGTGSQTVGDKTFFRKPGATIFQLFRNTGGPLDNVVILAPPPMPFATPIIPGTCDPGCIPNNDAVEALCGFPSPFPACNPGAPKIKVLENSDCPGGDSIPNNNTCDLPPGTYGDIEVQKNGRLALSAGDYNICSLKTARNATITGAGSRLLIPDGGFFKSNNNTDVGSDCGDISIFVDGQGEVSFGRNSFIAAKVCAPGSELKLGHKNTLKGQFIGDIVNANLNNVGECCGTCVCYATLTPTTAHVGDTVTATGGCDMASTSAVHVCGVNAMITTKTAAEVKFVVPAVGVLPQQCDVEFLSATGTFKGFQKLTVN